MDIVTVIFTILMKISMVLTALLLAPIDALIVASFPALDDGLTAIAGFVSIIASGLGWAISATGIPMGMIALLGLYLIVRVNVPITLYVFKLGLSWYKAIKG